ncbi:MULTISPECIES: OmpA family protein [Pseudomonas]|uniref:OmpA family protein n=1 Tax=Pseudomonas TaxID=286 RepID=UPI000876A4EC|nr:MULTISPECIES: OmpA family protein [Pseudomonas]MBP4002153.1 OmpA family protein [Pseudomonas koreensis]SCZ23560.1 Outer membrane protein OmpA [Pseudomonas sp. NFIX46]SDB60602.1 Outer membrane protein OmpA [Pseudomonas putida]SFQ75198.1 Outer membrane protein OmpA [Pseudomonas sp. NFIX49]
MSSKQTLALALCFAITGCAQTPKNDADGGSWWPFGSSDKVAAKEPAPAPAPLKPAATAPVAKAESSSPWYWPFGSDDSAAAKPEVKAEAKPEAKPVEVAKAEADKGGKWWWPFGGKEQDTAKVVPMPDPKVTQAWLDDYEPRLRTAIKDSNLQLERRENVLVVTAPVEGSFNPDRPAMLLPVTLGPFTRVAKILEADPKTAVLVLGHSDTTGAAPANVKLSQERAQAVAAIFRLSGLQRDRLMLRGMGSEAPRAANDSVEGRALNRRVELLVTPQNTMVALLSKYNMPAPKPVTMVAAQDVKPAAKPVTPAPAAKKAAVPATKKAPAKKAAAKAPAKKAPAKAPAKKTAPAKAAATDKKVAATDTTKK